MRIADLPFLVLASLAPCMALAQTTTPWKRSEALLVIDPYEGNSIDWDKAVADPKLRAVLHRASIGDRTDTAFVARAKEARTRGLMWGAYHLGKTGDPKVQADRLLELAAKTDTTFLALDIEALGGSNMALKDAEIFVRHVHERTGRYPALYINWSVYAAISRDYDANSIFAKTPLWIARFIPTLPKIQSKVWPDYTLWQFSSELNCPKSVRNQHEPKLCDRYRPYVIAGTRYDMDINYFNGEEAALKALFGVTP